MGVLVAEFTSAGVLNGSGSAYATATPVAWTDIASATTTDIGAVNTANLRVTGTTTITGLGTVATGTTRTLRFAGILTFTYNGTSLILPGAASITTAANDTCTAVSLGSGNWIIVDYQRASGLALVDNTLGTVTSVVAGSGLSGGTITATGTVAIDTNNGGGVGSTAILRNNTGATVAANDTASGASLGVMYTTGTGGGGETWAYTGSRPGTWRNIAGLDLLVGYGGLWIRVS